MDIRRYLPERNTMSGDEEFVEHQGGAWVRYSDYAAEVGRLEKALRDGEERRCRLMLEAVELWGALAIFADWAEKLSPEHASGEPVICFESRDLRQITVGDLQYACRVREKQREARNERICASLKTWESKVPDQLATKLDALEAAPPCSCAVPEPYGCPRHKDGLDLCLACGGKIAAQPAPDAAERERCSAQLPAAGQCALNAGHAGKHSNAYAEWKPAPEKPATGPMAELRAKWLAAGLCSCGCTIRDGRCTYCGKEGKDTPEKPGEPAGGG